MSEKTEYDRLQGIIRETANTSLSFGLNDDEWSAYFISQKKKFVNASFLQLCEDVSNFIVENRIQREIKNSNSKRKGVNKPYTL